MASPLLQVDHGAAAVRKKACRAAAAYAAFAATATTAAAAASAVLLLLLLCCCCCCCRCAAAELLLCCCCCHIRVPHLRVPEIVCCASRCQPIFPFSDTCTSFYFLWSDGISAIRSSRAHSKCCRNESGLFQARWNYWLNYSSETSF